MEPKSHASVARPLFNETECMMHLNCRLAGTDGWILTLALWSGDQRHGAEALEK